MRCRAGNRELSGVDFYRHLAPLPYIIGTMKVNSKGELKVLY